MKTVCLTTPAHLSANPRLVKEADTLAEAGYRVEVYACQYLDWATEADETVLAKARWRAHLLRWSADSRPVLFWKSRIRQHLCRWLLDRRRPDGLAEADEPLALRAYDRVIPELTEAVSGCEADLYVAHNLAALPVVAAAARRRGARFAFDAEDFLPGMRGDAARPSASERITDYVERRYLPQCVYVTAASPGIAKAYRERYAVPEPTVLLNVFPLSHRPEARRPTRADGPMTLYWFSQTIGASRGLEDAVRVLGALRGMPIELHLRGNWQPGYRDELYRLAAFEGVRAGQIVEYPPAAPDELVRLASEFDVGLALEPGRDENNRIAISNKLFTYLLAGNAVVATDTSGQREVLAKIGGAGFSYPPGDVAALAGQLRSWHDDRASLERARLAAWDWGTRRFNWDLESERYLALVHETMAACSDLPGR
ncbi:MAG: hypothetical protein IH968_03915 [Gemmatimonadetes bacterium]|nr:hypothetical protein [Gemmatimonadota bacterium]